MPKEREPNQSNDAGNSAFNSVYDFLYHDPRRIGSFLAQFNENGLLTGVSKSESSTQSRKRGWKVGGGGSIPNLATGNLEFELGPSDKGSNAFERSYDPLWTNAREFLDTIETRGLVRDNLGEATLGEFVLVEGIVVLIDTVAHQRLYQNESTRHIAIRNAQQRLKAAGESFDKIGARFEMDLIATLPPQVQLHMITDQGWMWATLRPEGLVTPATEIGMNHGIVIEGRWHTLGIKDANPALEDHLDAQAKVMTDRFSEMQYFKEIVTVNQNLRKLIGRPVDCYGITPLLIFRNVG